MKIKKKGLVVTLVGAMLLLWGAQMASAVPQEVLDILTDVPGSTAYVYGVQDERGETLDAIKIIENPEGGYLGVYHDYTTQFNVCLASSTDLINWDYQVTLETTASQPTIAYHPATGGFLVVYEDSLSGGSCLEFKYYDSLNDLLNANPSETYQAPRTYGDPCEGTPCVYSISDDVNTIKVGHHFYKDSNVDVVANGTLTGLCSESRNWSSTEWTTYNNTLKDKGVNGNIGDRDYGWLSGGEYNIQEGQLSKGVWESWRSWLYDYDTEDFTFLDVQTHGGSTAFGNSTFTVLTSPNDVECVVVTYFLFSEGAANGESGPLIFYTETGATPTPTPTPTGPTPTPTPTPTGAHTYNFEGITQSNTDYNAYACDVDVFTFAGKSSNRNSQVEATDSQYVNISADNTAEWATVDPSRNDEIFLWVEMKIEETPGSINQIDLTFNGNTDGTSTTTHKIYVMKAGADWTQDASWVQVGDSLDIEPDVDTEMTRSITSSITDYIDGSGNIIWGVYETTSSEDMRINYLEMVVTY